MSGVKEVVLNSKTWGKSLIHHRKMMKSEYKKSISRLAFLAEERHLQYREDYIDHVKLRIEQNKKAVAEQAKQIKELSNASAKKKTLIDMGWDSLRKQMSQEKEIKRANNKILFEKTKILQDRARREWLIEMNDKCTLWNKSPDELKYSKYRLLNKKILERIPRDKNYVLDLNEQPEDGAVFETSSVDGYKGPLRSNTQHLAYVLANNNGKLVTTTKDNNNKDNEQPLSIDPSSPDYPEYLEFMKYNKERERRKEQKLRQRAEDNITAYHTALNSENALLNNTSGLDLDLLTEDLSSSLTYSETLDTDELAELRDQDDEFDEDDEEFDEDDDEEFDEDEEDEDNNDFSFLDKK